MTARARKRRRDKKRRQAARGPMTAEQAAELDAVAAWAIPKMGAQLLGVPRVRN